MLGGETRGVETMFNTESGVMIAGVKARMNLGVDAKTDSGAVQIEMTDATSFLTAGVSVAVAKTQTAGVITFLEVAAARNLWMWQYIPTTNAEAGTRI